MGGFAPRVSEPGCRVGGGVRSRGGSAPACASSLGDRRLDRVVHNDSVGSAQKRQGGGRSLAGVLLLAAGVTATVVAWGVLDLAAIAFGRSARDGQEGDWMFLALATVGAIACMFLAILLAARIQAVLRGDPTRPHSRPSGHQHQSDQPRPKGIPAGGKRAAR